MNLQHLEFNTAYELIAYATEKLEPHVDVEDLDAAVVAVLATAIESATYRTLKPLEELFIRRSYESR
jgi:hypothetical protein